MTIYPLLSPWRQTQVWIALLRTSRTSVPSPWKGVCVRGSYGSLSRIVVRSPRRLDIRPRTAACSARWLSGIVWTAPRSWRWSGSPIARADLMLEYLVDLGTALEQLASIRNPRAGALVRRDEYVPGHQEFVVRMRELNRRFRRGEWARLHPAEIERGAIDSSWRQGERADFLGDSWESIRALLKLRLDY